MQNLLTVARIKAQAHGVYVKEIAQKEFEIRFSLYERAKLHPERLPEFLAAYDGTMKLLRGETPSLLYAYKKNSREEKKDVVKLVTDILEHMKSLL